MGLYKRGSTYWIDFYIGGKRFREAIGTREEARVALGERLQSKRQGCNPELRKIEPVSFKAHAAEVLEKHYATTRSYGWAKLVIEKHLIHRFGTALVGNITPKMVTDYMHDRTGQGMARATVDGERAILSCILSFAVKWRRLHRDVNPMHEVPRLGEHNHRDRYLRPEEQRALIDAARARGLDYLADVIVFGLGTGARPPKELLSVMWTDLDWERRTIRLRAETTKDGKPRDLPLNDAVIAMLEERRARSSSRFSPYIFTRHGKPLRSIRTAWNRVRKDAELGPEVTPYVMRHTFCTRYSHSGGEAKDLQALAGHADFRTTQNYLHTDQDHARATVNRMAADLAGVKQDGHKLVTSGIKATA